VVTSYNQVAARSLERIAALGDGVFAIAMTLIVFGIRVPDPGPVQSEQELWNAQQTGLLYFARADRDLSWLQLGFLATVALMPFSAARSSSKWPNCVARNCDEYRHSKHTQVFTPVSPMCRQFAC